MTNLNICKICNKLYFPSFINIFGISVCEYCYINGIYCINCNNLTDPFSMKIHVYLDWITTRLCASCIDFIQMRYLCKNLKCIIKNNGMVITNYSELPIHFDFIRPDGTFRACNLCLFENKLKNMECLNCKVQALRIDISCKKCKSKNLEIERCCFICNDWISLKDEKKECKKNKYGHVI